MPENEISVGTLTKEEKQLLEDAAELILSIRRHFCFVDNETFSLLHYLYNVLDENFDL